ncbi:hypothetical protein D3C83_252810 [compost metagenome]
MRRVDAGDINSKELIVGGSLAAIADGKKLKDKGACVLAGVKAAAEEVKKRIQETLQSR